MMRRFKLTIPEGVFIASIIIAFGVVYMTINSQKDAVIGSISLDNAQARISRLEAESLNLEAINKKFDELKVVVEELTKAKTIPVPPVIVKFTEPIRINVVYKEAMKKPLIPTGQPPLVSPPKIDPKFKRTNLTPMLNRAMESLHGKGKK